MNILSSFDTFFNEARKTRSAVDLDSKRRSKEQLAVRGLPTRIEEAWRNTPLKFLNDFPFKPVVQSPAIGSAIKALIAENKIKNTQSIVFVNGFFIADQSDFDENAIFIELKTEIKTQSADDVSNVIQTLNDIYSLNPAEIIIKKDLTVPIQIINLTNMDEAAELIVCPKVKFVLKANKEAQIIVSNVGPSGARYVNMAHFIFEIENDARLTLVNSTNQSLNAYHLDTVSMSASSASTVKYFELNYNALVIRHELFLNLNGERIQSQILGASYLKQKQHCDSQSFISHNQSHSQSEQVYKALLDDESHSVFSGTVFIEQGIVKADSAQLNQSLLLSEHAEVNSQPILRIYSDDVKASHGSTMGQIQEDEIFYLQSRAISREKAVEILGQGFLNEIIFRLENSDLRNYFSTELSKELGRRRNI